MKTILVSNTKNKFKKKNLKKIILGNWYFNTYKKIKSKNYFKFKIDSIAKRKECIKKSLKLEDKLHKNIAEILNKHHFERKNNRQWKIIVGHWLRSYIRIFTNRYLHISRILKKKKIDVFVVEKRIANQDYNEVKDFIADIGTEEFNTEIYKNILEFKETKTKIIIKDTIYRKTLKKKNFYKDYVFNFINLISFKKDKYFLINLYINFLESMSLQAQLLIFPKFWDYKQFNNYSTVDLKLRDQLKKKLNIGKKKNLENFLKKNLFTYMPKAYLEDYKRIEKFTENYFPKNPKVLITANSFFFNETFKNYTSNKLKKTKYIVMQHGNNYNTHYDEHYASIEMQTADYFVSWDKNKKKHINGFVQKKLVKKDKNTNNLLIMHAPFDVRDKIWDANDDYASYIERTQGMLNLIKKIKHLESIIYRVSNNHNNIDNLNYFKKSSKKIVVNFSKTKLIDDINNSKICLFTYNSSGFYENLSNNIPTILFVNKTYLDEIDNKTKKNFLKLKKNNVIFFEKRKLYKFLNSNWLKINYWWNEEKTQDAINNFCINHAIRNRRPMSKIAGIIRSVA